MTYQADQYRKLLTERLSSDLAAEVSADDLPYVVRAIVDRVQVSDDGKPLSDVRRAVSDVRVDEQWWFTRPASQPAAPETPVTAARRRNLTDALVARANARRETAPEIPAGNPWRKGEENLTRQCLIQNRAPELAARLKAEATR